VASKTIFYCAARRNRKAFSSVILQERAFPMRVFPGVGARPIIPTPAVPASLDMKTNQADVHAGAPRGGRPGAAVDRRPRSVAPATACAARR
jgi:hypothetical protein